MTTTYPDQTVETSTKQTPPIRPPAPPDRPSHKRLLALTIGGVAAVMVIAAGGYAAYQASQPEQTASSEVTEQTLSTPGQATTQPRTDSQARATEATKAQQNERTDALVLRKGTTAMQAVPKTDNQAKAEASTSDLGTQQAVAKTDNQAEGGTRPSTPEAVEPFGHGSGASVVIGGGQ